MDPTFAITALTWVTSNAAQGAPLAWCLGSILSGLLGNEAHRFYREKRSQIAKALAPLTMPENHDLARAVRTAQIEALERLSMDYRDAHRAGWDASPGTRPTAFLHHIDGVWRDARNRLADAAFDLSVTDNLRGAFEGLLSDAEAGGAAAERTQLMAGLAEDAVFEELRATLGTIQIPPDFAAHFRNGTGDRPRFLDLFGAFFTEQIKPDTPARAIFTGKLLTRIEGLAYDRTEIVRRIEMQFGDVLAEVNDRTKRIEQRIEKLLGMPIRNGAASTSKLTDAIRNRPTNLLVARFQAIPYIDRDCVLEAALKWARDETPELQGRLYVAPGGFGKTRFAIEMQNALSADGWQCTFVSTRYTYTLGALTVFLEREDTTGSLIVIDYAESQSTLLKQIADAAAASKARTPIRLLALARSAEGWWEGTSTDGSMSGVFEPTPIKVISHPLTPAERAAFFDRASTAFRKALEGVRLAALRTPTQPDIAGRAFDRPLTVAMAAFLFARGIASPKTESVFQRVFIEERNYWKRRLGVETDNDPAMVSLHRAAAQFTLVQGVTHAGAEALIDADPRAARYGPLARDQCIAKLETIYGDTIDETPILRPIEPDLLGEHAAMVAIAQDKDNLVEATLSTALAGVPLFPDAVTQALTVLDRATRHEHDQRTQDAAKIAIARVSESVLVMNRMMAREMEAALPELEYPTIRVRGPLTDLSAVVARRVVETSHSAAEKAVAIGNLSIRLREAGDRDGSVSADRDAVELFEQLVRENPSVYREQLASGLHNLAIHLAEAGNEQEALSPALRAVAIRENLAGENPPEYLPGLARSLNSLSHRLRNTGDLRRGLAAARTAVKICEDLKQIVHPAVRAASLRDFGVLLAEAGDQRGALDATQASVEAYEQLVRERSVLYRPDLARSLSSLADLLNSLGHRQEVLKLAQRVVEIYEQLAEENPVDYEREWAASLLSLSNHLADSGNPVGALAPVKRAVMLFEQMAQGDASHRLGLAITVNTLGTCLREAGKGEGALAAGQRAVALFEQLVSENPTYHLPYLAAGLNNLAIALSGMGDLKGALVPAQRAVDIYKPLAQRNPSAYSAKLALSLNALAICLMRTGDVKGALVTAQFEVKLYEQLVSENLAFYLPYLAGELNTLANALIEMGDLKGALVPAQRAVDICEALAQRDPTAYRAQSAACLNTLAAITHESDPDRRPNQR